MGNFHLQYRLPKNINSENICLTKVTYTNFSSAEEFAPAKKEAINIKCPYKHMLSTLCVI